MSTIVRALNALRTPLMGGLNLTRWSIPSELSGWWHEDAASIPICVDRVRTRTEENQRNDIERDDDCRCCIDAQSEPDKSMAEQPDRGSNRRHVARKHGNGQQYSGSLHPAGKPLSATVTLDQQSYRDGGPHEQQTNPRPSRRKH